MRSSTTTSSSEARPVPNLTSAFTIQLVGISLAIGPVKRLGLGAIGLPKVLPSSKLIKLLLAPVSLMAQQRKLSICFEQHLSILPHQAEPDSENLDPSLKKFSQSQALLAYLQRNFVLGDYLQ